MTVEEIKAMQTTFTQFKEANEALQTEVKSFGKANSDTLEKLNKVQGDLDELETKINKRMDAEEFGKFKTELMTRLDDIEAKVVRKGKFADPDAGDSKIARVAFFDALRWVPLPGGKSIEETLGPDKMKALVLSNNEQGGFLAPTEYVMETLRNITEFAGIRNLCNIRTTSRTGINIPKRNGAAAAAWVTETGTRSETANPSFGMLDIPTHEMYAMTKVSKQELEDSVFDIEGFLREEYGEQFGVTEADSIINGNGVGKPEGVLVNSGISYVPSGDANLLTGDGLIALYYELKEAYINAATWVMNRSTLKTVRQLKEGVTGQYLWAPGIKADARPATILDRPYITAPEMPAVTANAYPVLLGDFRRGYTIVDRIGMEITQDPFTSKSTGMIEFSARRRVGGRVTIAEAIKKLKIATS